MPSSSRMSTARRKNLSGRAVNPVSQLSSWIRLAPNLVQGISPLFGVREDRRGGAQGLGVNANLLNGARPPMG